MAMPEKKPSYPQIYRVIMRNMKLLRKPGVLTARPGYKISGGKVIDKPSIVVTVVTKKDGLTARNKLPAEIGDIPVDVREASPMQLLRAKDPDSFHILQAVGPRELHEPESKWECDMKTRKVMASPSPAAKAAIASVKGRKTPVKYKPPPKEPLTAIKSDITITAYSSPDDGYKVLSTFLKGAKKELVIGMYDFTSGDLLKDVIATVKPKEMDFTMVLDHPAQNSTANQTDEDTRAEIKASNDNANINWALSKFDPEVSATIFPAAYHIKVVVRDQAMVWLSSGNFNVSNQPNLAVKKDPRGSFKTADRDWHVIVEDKGLAKLFRAYLQNDFEVAGHFQRDKPAPGNALAQEALKKASAMQPKRSGFANPDSLPGKHKVFTSVPVTIQPLLTPDMVVRTTKPMYVDQIVKLIQSAKHTIHVQLQYISFPKKAAATNITKVVQALGDALIKIGLDVKIIVSQFQKGPDTERLAEFGLDTVLRHMTGVHNKGIVVDGQKVVVSSQNWSEEGVSTNRDAGLIIENAEIASFFDAIFMDDWLTRTGKHTANS
jgi:phosphatidylserine/phosphatidylglycerophosphate/cardiolipin synthase-like enzyme